ncbi:MAG: hypothetical protein KGJ13_04620, partial [Patescibacteria group bacterium]|nr:hypothetical protein [Patescibacteria group bacterium]
MAKINRKTAIIFGSGASSQDIEQFGSKVQAGNPNYTTDPAVIQSLSAWTTGWSAALNGTNNSEYKQDRNAVDYVASYQIAYLLQQGIPEWDSGTTYYTYSFVSYGGLLYVSLADGNLNNTPPASGNTAYWQSLFLGAQQNPTITVLTSGSGNYTAPSGVQRIYVRMVGGGGGGGSPSGSGVAGTSTTFGTFTCTGGGGGAASTG